MGAYLSQPVTDKETFVGAKAGFLEFGGSSMQGWRRTMEDAHIATIDLGNAPDAAIFGVFDGHGGSEVAKFCQKYLAGEITRLEKYHEGNLPDSLVEVFHKMDSMLKDGQYHAELEELRRNAVDAPADRGAPGVGAGLGGNEGVGGGDASEEDSQVSTSEALDMLRQVLMMRRMQEGGEDDEAEPMSEDGPAHVLQGEPPSQEGEEGSNGPQQQQQRGPASLAEANPPARVQLQQAQAAPPAAARQPLSVDIPPKADSLPEHRIQAGCTAVVAVVKGNELWVANAGDSRAVLCRGGQALALSEDHKPQSEGERNRIQAAGGFVSDVGGVSRVNGNLNLSRAIGDLKYKGNDALAPDAQIITAQPDIVKVELRPEDRFFVLACDGVWDVMSNQEVVQFVSVCLDSGMALPDIASQLLDACLAPDPRETRGIGCDNMTCCIVVVNRDAPTASLPPFSGGGTAQGQEHGGNAPAQPQQQAPAPDQDAPQPMHPGPVPPGLEQPSAAASARAH